MVLVAGPPGGMQLLLPPRGRAPDRAEVERFKEQQRARGFEVRERSGGVLEIRPAPEGAAR
jgi:hypothetical protein